MNRKEEDTDNNLLFEENMKLELRRAQLEFECLKAFKKQRELSVFEQSEYYKLNKYIGLLEIQLGLSQISINNTSKYRV